jgi:hypothetical protein
VQTDPSNLDERDVALAEELQAHHAEMISTLEHLTTALADAARSGDGASHAKHALETWVADVLVPHAAEEEQTTYRGAGDLPEGKLLIKSMLAEHELIRLTARHLSEAQDPVAAATFARALFDMFDSHQRKENDIILPLLLGAEAVSLSEIMVGAHDHDHDHDRHGQP